MLFAELGHSLSDQRGSETHYPMQSKEEEPSACQQGAPNQGKMPELLTLLAPPGRRSA